MIITDQTNLSFGRTGIKVDNLLIIFQNEYNVSESFNKSCEGFYF